MLGGIKRRLILTETLLLVFVTLLGVLYYVYTVPLNVDQLRWLIIGTSWQAVLLGLPLVLYQPLFRRIARDAARIESGEELPTFEQVRFLERVLVYPVRVSFGCTVPSVLGVGLVALQMRYFAALPWEGVGISLICGLIAGLLWGTIEYFIVEHIVRPLTRLIPAAAAAKARAHRVSLALKIFICSLVLVTASLGVFGVMAYTRAARIVEQQVGERLQTIVQEIANLTAELQPTETGELSDVWWSLVTEYRASPRGYIHLLDSKGKLLRTHPATEGIDKTVLADEGFLPTVTETIMTGREGFLVDRVGLPRVIAYTYVPDSKLKLVAISPRSDFSIYLDHFVRSGLAAMGFSALIALGIGFLSARSITTALSRVTRAAQAVTLERDLSRRVTFLTNDEVGVLAQAFNEMAGTLQTYAEGLEELVAARTRELELRGEQLEQKNVEMRDFLYVVSHDLRAPLINLEGFSRALQESVGTLDGLMGGILSGKSNGDGTTLASEWSGVKEEVEESVTFILRSVSKMDMLAKALLELSRIETRPHMPQRIDTTKMLEEIIGSLRFQAEQRGIVVTAHDLPPIDADGVRINQVFTNLIDNAIKYMKPTGDKRIDIGCDEHDGFLHFYVRDTGPGIRPEDQAKVFRLFARLVTNTIPGEGVGLAAVRKIVEKHGGRIWVESTVGVGSTFWFSIPKPGAEGSTERSTEEDERTGTDHDLDG